MIEEQNVREQHGVFAGQGSLRGHVTADENHGDITIGIRGTELTMNPDSALRLASMLRRLARRVKARTS